MSPGVVQEERNHGIDRCFLRNPLGQVRRQGYGPRGPDQELEEVVVDYPHVLRPVHDDVTGMSARPVQLLDRMVLQRLYRSWQQVVLVQHSLASLLIVVNLLEHEPAPVGWGSPRVEAMLPFGRPIPVVERVQFLGHHPVAVHGSGQMGYDTPHRPVVPHRVGVVVSHLSAATLMRTAGRTAPQWAPPPKWSADVSRPAFRGQLPHLPVGP